MASGMKPGDVIIRLLKDRKDDSKIVLLARAHTGLASKANDENPDTDLGPACVYTYIYIGVQISVETRPRTCNI